MNVRLTPSSLSILLVLLSVVGCDSTADRKSRPNQTGTEKKGLESTKSSASTASAPSSQVDDDLESNFREAADDVEQAVGGFQQGNHEWDQEVQELVGLTETAEDLARGSRNWWISLLGTINEAVTSVGGDPEKPAVSLENVSVERLDDLSNWFESLPSSAMEKLSEVDRRTPPTGAGWLLTLQFNVDATGETHKEMILTALVTKLRNSKPPDKLRLTHLVWKESGATTVVEFVVRNS